jgi:hypothetical protein
MLNPCGVSCSECSWLAKGCAGCRELNGKPFWTSEHTEKGVCPIYDCSVNNKKLQHCGECEKLPCQTFTGLRDPSMSDEEYQQSLKNRISNLNKLINK